MFSREGRRKGERAWQDHFVDTIIEGVPRNFQAESQVPDDLHASEFEIAWALHVDDGDVAGPAEKMEVVAYFKTKIVLQLSPIIGVGNSFEHVGVVRVIDEEGMWVKELDKYETSLLSMMQMKNCRPSTSSKLD